MNDEERVRAAYEAICAYLTKENLGHEREDERMTVYLTLAGKKFPVAMAVRADRANVRVEVFCRLPMLVSDEAAALATVNAYNSRIGAGRFVLRDGAVEYEDTHELRGVEGVTDAFGEAVVMRAFATVDGVCDV